MLRDTVGDIRATCNRSRAGRCAVDAVIAADTDVVVVVVVDIDGSGVDVRESICDGVRVGHVGDVFGGG